MVAIQLLGEVTAQAGRRQVDLGPPRQRCVLAALAVDAARVVTPEQLAARVWTPEVAGRRRASLHSYLTRLRRALAGDDGADIVRRSGGYVLVGGHTDLARFRELCTRARGETDGRHAERLLTEALALWCGEALTGLDSEWAQAERDRLHHERMVAEHTLTDFRLRLGEGPELLPGLSERVAAQPLDERAAAQYMLALHQAGRPAEALAYYQQVRERLVAELGTDPGPPLQDLHRRLLGSDPSLAGTPVPAPAPVPRQLPATPVPFVGRRDELDRLGAALRDAAGRTTVMISAIAGAGGIGKTWLALHWAHRYLEKFPDGQLFVDLQGFSPAGPPMTPMIALRGFLDALGVEPHRVPLDLHAQAALFRSLVAGKRMLVVLDNAADTAQVTPLLPGSGTCTVIVTSRNRMPGLLTGHAARPILLDVLSAAEARAVLADRLGAARVDAEPAAVDELLGFCGGFPLALGIVAGHVHLRPRLRLADLATELREAGLSALDHDDPAASLPAVLSWSQRALRPESTRMFALLGIAPGPCIRLPAATCLAGRPASATRTALRDLENASLLAEGAAGQYWMHELIRGYAAGQEFDGAERNAALRRILDFYLHTAYAADRLLAPERDPIGLAGPSPACAPLELPDSAAALTWLTEEHGNLLAAQRAAIALGDDRYVWQLAWVLNTVHHRRGLLHDELGVWQAALANAHRLGEPAVSVLVLRMLGRVLGELNHDEDAEHHFRQALALAEHEGDLVAQAYVHGHLGALSDRRADHQRAFEQTRRAYELFRAAGNPVREAQTVSNLGWSAARLGRYAEAREYCEIALALCRSLDDRDGEAHIFDSLGYIEDHDGHPELAAGFYWQAIAVRRELGDLYQTANTLEELGRSYATAGNHRQARAAWGEAADLYRAQRRTDEAARLERRLAQLSG